MVKISTPLLTGEPFDAILIQRVVGISHHRKGRKKPHVKQKQIRPPDRLYCVPVGRTSSLSSSAFAHSSTSSTSTGTASCKQPPPNANLKTLSDTKLLG